ncbi:MAG: hypothetical protein NE328_04160 [Lentisphaeraceae bacterium]|nr:hypothetical protein [Lentisphaeraceae bacterium]
MKYILMTLLLSFTFLNANAADSNLSAKEALMDKGLNLLEELITAIESAKDDESSKAAMKTIQALMPKAQALKTEGEKVGMDNLTPEEQKALETKFKGRQENLQKRLFGVIAILQKNPALMGAFQKLQQEIK